MPEHDHDPWDENAYHAALQDTEPPPGVDTNGAAAQPPAERPWLIDGADLLTEPDPGPTPWLVQDLIVDEALTAVVGKWKTTKSWAMLEIAISIATGTPAFGQAEIPNAGPVIYIIEESGRRALWRRLDALCRGRAIKPEQLRKRLHLAPNARIKLDDPTWQRELTDLGTQIEPRAYIFDPLARMKAPARDESAQTDMAVVIEYLRTLRDDTGAAPIFVHHLGHQGEHMRGTSDLESAWESKLAISRDTDNGTVTVKASHREEEDGGLILYQLAYDGNTRTMRLRTTTRSTDQRIIDWLQEHGEGGAGAIAKGIEIRRSDVDKSLLRLQDAGTTLREQSQKRDDLGRPYRQKVWKLAKQATFKVVPDDGRSGTSMDNEGVVDPRSSHPLKGGRPDDLGEEPEASRADAHAEDQTANPLRAFMDAAERKEPSE